MKAVYFSNIGSGHLFSSLPMIEQLVKRGVQVLYFSTEENREHIEAKGARYCYADMQIEQEVLHKAVTTSGAHLVILAQAEKMIKSTLPILEQEKPDFIITDKITLAGRLAAKRLRLPLISFHTHFASNEHWSFHSYMQKLTEEDPIYWDIKEKATYLSENYGVPMEDLMDFGKIMDGRGDFNVVRPSKFFQPAGDTFGEDYFFAGSQIAKREGNSTWQSPTDGRPLLFVSLGTMRNNWLEFYHMLFEVVKDMELNVLCAIGNILKAEDLGVIPANVTLMPFVPQLEVLSYASYFLTHAGMGSAMETLSFGVPCVCVPTQGEQIANAMRLVEMGVAAACLVKEQLSVESLREALDKLMTDVTYTQNAQAYANEMKLDGGPEAAAEKIIDFVKKTCYDNNYLDDAEKEVSVKNLFRRD
ncbi:MAG: hypothetical protein IKM28_04655 [Lachnospiraceae bacterium]|nr:hypothetical protein [Lachnospiraceae bacterium]